VITTQEHRKTLKFFNCFTKLQLNWRGLLLNLDLRMHKPMQEVHVKESFVTIIMNVLLFLRNMKAGLFSIPDLLCLGSESMWQSFVGPLDGL
jgi:hypothetical protein